MSIVSLGDLAQSFVLRRQNTALKTELTRLSTEMATGVSADKSARVSGDLVPLAGIEASLARLTGYKAVTAETGLFAGVMQTTLATVEGMASDLSNLLLASSVSALPTRVDAVASDAHQRLESVLAALNTRFGDRTLFAGVGTNGPAIVGADTLLAALDTAIIGATTAADIETAIEVWFNAPSGYGATAYLGGGPLAAAQIAPGESAALDITAADPAIRDTIKGLAMAAMLQRGVLAGQNEARADLAKRAGESLLGSQTDWALLAARLGTVEAQISNADTRNSAETSGLQIALAELLAVDPYETAARLEAAQTQLETLYALTARMTRLSLVDYLR